MCSSHRFIPSKCFVVSASAIDNLEVGSPRVSMNWEHKNNSKKVFNLVLAMSIFFLSRLHVYLKYHEHLDSMPACVNRQVSASVVVQHILTSQPCVYYNVII